MAAAARPTSGGAAATEPSLAQLERLHRQRVEKLKHDVEGQYKRASAQGQTATAALLQATNRDIHAVVVAERRLEADVRDLQKQTDEVRKRTEKWAKEFVKFNAALKELGDVAHWSACVERDVADTVSLLDAVVTTRRRAAGMSDAPAGTDAATNSPR